MKYLTIILLLMCLSCKSPKYIYEDTLYVTRKYCGNYDTSYVEGKFTKVITTTDYFYVNGRIMIGAKKDTRCYLKYIPDYIDGAKIWVLYFTYDGTDDFFMLRQNFITGNVY